MIINISKDQYQDVFDALMVGSLLSDEVVAVERAGHVTGLKKGRARALALHADQVMRFWEKLGKEDADELTALSNVLGRLAWKVS